MAMRFLIASAAIIALSSGVAAQTELPENTPVDEIIEDSLPGVYSVTITIDGRLQIYPDIMNALRGDELEGMAAFAALAVEDHHNWTQDAPDWSWNEYFSETGITVTFSNEDIVSLNRQTSYYTGGAHPNQSVSPVVTRAGNLDPASLGDLIADSATDSPGLTALFYAVYRELMAMKRVRLGTDFDEAMERETWLAPLAPEAEAFPGFTLMPNASGVASGGLMFHFEPYAVGSYAEGSYDVPVPLSVFEEYLTEDWADVFDGAPSQAVLTNTGDALEPIIPASEE